MKESIDLKVIISKKDLILFKSSERKTSIITMAHWSTWKGIGDMCSQKTSDSIASFSKWLKHFCQVSYSGNKKLSSLDVWYI